MEVKYIGEQDYIALDWSKVYEVLSVEKGWHRIMTELDEDYFFSLEAFEIVEDKKCQMRVSVRANKCPVRGSKGSEEFDICEKCG